MSDNDWDDNNSGNDNSAGPKALRDAYEKMKADFEAMKAEAEKLRAEQRKTTIASVLTSKGFNPKIASLVPSSVEATEEKVAAWLEDNADVFKPETSTGGSGGSDGMIRDGVSSTDAAPPVDRIGQAAAMALPPEALRRLEADLDNAKSPDEIEKVLQAHRDIRFR